MKYLDPISPSKTSSSSTKLSSTVRGPLHINARFTAPANTLTRSTISVASSSARGSTAPRSASNSAKRPSKCDAVPGKTPPVTTRYIARE